MAAKLLRLLYKARSRGRGRAEIGEGKVSLRRFHDILFSFQNSRRTLENRKRLKYASKAVAVCHLQSRKLSTHL